MAKKLNKTQLAVLASWFNNQSVVVRSCVKGFILSRDLQPIDNQIVTKDN